jgi:high-affinity nickel permease
MLLYTSTLVRLPVVVWFKRSNKWAFKRKLNNELITIKVEECTQVTKAVLLVALVLVAKYLLRLLVLELNLSVQRWAVYRVLRDVKVGLIVLVGSCCVPIING